MEIIKKRIVFSVSNDLTYDQRMIRICTSLTQGGFDVRLVGRKLTTSLPLKEQSFHQKRLQCIFTKGKLFYLEFNIRLFFYLLFTGAEIYGAIDTDTLLPNTLVCLVKSRKLTFDAHEYFTEVPEVHDRIITRTIWKIVENICMPVTSLRYTVSESLASIFAANMKREFSVIRNVPVLQTESTAIRPTPNGKPIIFYQGDLNEGRGIETVIVCMKELHAVLHIAGNGPLKAKLEALIEAHDLHHKVKLLGYVLPEELKTITAGATIGLNLLENKGKSYYYSLSNKFFNYMHAQIPQVCADFPEYQLINAQHKIALLCDLQAQNVAAALHQLISNSTLYNELKTNCITAKQVYNWNTEEAVLLKLYRGI